MAALINKCDNCLYETFIIIRRKEKASSCHHRKRVLMGVPNYQLTTNFSANCQLTNNFSYLLTFIISQR